MAIRIFHFEGSGGGFERSLELEDDGTLIYDESPNFYAYKSGARGETRRLSVAEAKSKWPKHAKDINRAVERLGGSKGSN